MVQAAAGTAAAAVALKQLYSVYHRDCCRGNNSKAENPKHWRNVSNGVQTLPILRLAHSFRPDSSTTARYGGD